MYYNKDRKEMFIEEKESTTIVPDGYLNRLFRACEPLENEFKKDVCDFSSDEIATLYRGFHSASAGRLMFDNSYLRQYTAWCIRQGHSLNSTNEFDKFDFEMLTKLINKKALDKKIVFKDVLEEWEDRLFNPSDKFLLRAIYEGISGKELCELVDLKISDFDFGNHTVKLHSWGKDRTISVSDTLCRYALESAEEKHFYPNNGEKCKTGDNIAYQFDPERILKVFSHTDDNASSFNKGRRLKNKLLRIARYVNAGLMTANSLQISGKINFINERCRDLGITGKEFLFSDHIEELNNQYNGRVVKCTFYKAFGPYLVGADSEDTESLEE